MTLEEFSGRGFAAGTVRAVRSFEVDALGRLTGVHHKQVWTPGENNAECRADQLVLALARMNSSMSTAIQSYRNPPKPNPYRPLQRYFLGSWIDADPRPDAEEVELEPAPDAHAFESCSCGFYGYFDGSDDYHDHGRITGVIEGYGETIIGTRGIRAMKARIVALKVSAGEVAYPLEGKVRRNYASVPFFDTFERLVGEFPPDQSHSPSPDTDPDFWTRSI